MKIADKDAVLIKSLSVEGLGRMKAVE